jgi:hypothetical protein
MAELLWRFIEKDIGKFGHSLFQHHTDTSGWGDTASGKWGSRR